jgi:alkylhydroperoxidase family enzyme
MAGDRGSLPAGLSSPQAPGGYGILMARLPYRETSDLPREHQDLLLRPIALNKVLANSPTALRAFQGLGQFIRHGSRFDPRLRELAILQVGYLARAPYEWSHHIRIGREFGVTDDDIRGLIDETEGRPSALDQLSRLVLRAAREITAQGEAAEATFAALAQHLDAERLVDLTITISFYNAVVRVLATLRVDVEEDYQPYLRQFPLPR